MYYLYGLYGNALTDNSGEELVFATRDVAIEKAMKYSLRSGLDVVVKDGSKAIANVSNGSVNWLIPMKGPYQ